MSNRLSQFTVYTIRKSQDLDDIYATGGKGRLTERKKWVTALGLFEQAKDVGVRLPIIFADAGNTFDGLIYYAFITDLSTDKSTTTCSFEGLCRLDPRPPRHTLRLRNTGEPLSDSSIRPLAYVHTPDYIRAPTGRFSPQRSAKTSPAQRQVQAGAPKTKFLCAAFGL
jgi:hypothetical protein